MTSARVLPVIVSFQVLAAVAGAQVKDKATRGEPDRSPVEVTRVMNNGPVYRIEAIIRNSTPLTQPVLLLRLPDATGFVAAQLESGEPAMPRVAESTQLHKGPDGLSEWVVDFLRPPWNVRSVEAYVIVCSVARRPGWSRERDYKGFVYLPFNNARAVDDALRLLRDFGWEPTGLTRVEVPFLR